MLRMGTGAATQNNGSLFTVSMVLSLSYDGFGSCDKRFENVNLCGTKFTAPTDHWKKELRHTHNNIIVIVTILQQEE